jgi:hypothetical protein
MKSLLENMKMNYRFLITDDEFSEFYTHNTKENIKHRWQYYLILPIIFIAYNIYAYTTMPSSYEFSFVSIIGWLVLIFSFSFLWASIFWGGPKIRPKIFLIVFITILTLNILGFDTESKLLQTILNYLFLIAIFWGLWSFSHFLLKKMNIKISSQTQDREAILCEREIIFEEQAVIYKDNNTNTTYKWDAFNKWKQTKNLYILFRTDSAAIIVPKRIFQNEQEQIDFETLLNRKIIPT